MPEPVAKVAGMFLSDVHLSARAPTARSAEPDWMVAQHRVIDEVGLLRRKLGNPPLFIVGDLFDTSSQPVWFLNWLMVRLRSWDAIAVPGQHDIPSHNYQLLPRSAYWNLVESGCIRNLTPGVPFEMNNLIVSGFPYGADIRPPAKTLSLALNVAIIHGYIWTSDKTCYPGAPLDKKAGNWLAKLNGHYDAAFFGDNHIGWWWQDKNVVPSVTNSAKRKCSLFNCGALIRRRHDEKLLKPRVGLLHFNGSIVPHFLSTDKDKFTTAPTNIEKISKALNMSLEGFVDELARMRDLGYNWTATVKREVEKHKLDAETQTLILSLVSDIKNQPKPE